MHRPPRIRKAVLPLLALVIAISATLIAVVVIFEEGPGGRLNPNRVDVTYVSWFDQNGNYLGDSSGGAVTGGSTFATTLSLTCPQWPLNCSSSEVLTYSDMAGLGQSGWVRSFAETSSNLPLTIPAGGSAAITMTVLVPNQDFSGWLRVTLNVTS